MQTLEEEIKNSSEKYGRLELYFGSIRKFACLSREQEISLFKQLKEGTTYDVYYKGRKRCFSIVSRTEEAEKAHRIIAESNLKLVPLVISKFIRGYRINGEEEFLELVSEGNLGLLRAIDMFDYKKDVKFSTYACYWIKSALSYSLRKKGKKQMREVQMPQEYHREVRRDNEFPDEYNFFDNLYKKDLYDYLRSEIYKVKNKRAREILIKKYFKGMTLSQIGECFGISREYVRQICDREINKIRRKLESKNPAYPFY